MYKNELDKILEASRKGTLSFFVGAGVSKLSNAPTWKELIDAICIELGRDVKDKYSSDEYLQLPQIYYYSIDKNEEIYYSFIKSHVCTDDLKPNKIHHELMNLLPISFITTNYDTLLEETAIQRSQRFKTITTDSDIPSINGDRYILKMHGDFKHNNIVLKEEDYLNYSDNFKLIETLTKALFSTNTVVFIGYSLNDYNIKLILNWTKSLLKSDFPKPFFVYTGKNRLTSEELVYLESKGLSVIDCTRLNPKAENYMDRYASFFDALRNRSYFSLTNKPENEAFNRLFKLLKPLNKLRAIRKSDLSSKLPSSVIVAENGVITILKDNEIIFKKFISIHNLSKTARKKCSEKNLIQFETIQSVLKKARISKIIINDGLKNEQIDIDLDYPFADELCITHDYSAMLKITQEKTRSIHKDFQRAFYFSRIRRYDKSFFLFSEVAQRAFKSNNYLLYYLAKSNCISLYKIINKVNYLYNCYDMDAIKTAAPTNSEIEDLFFDLPIDFRNSYESLKDIYSSDILYKYSYDSFIDGQKLIKNIDSNTIEFGTTSSGKVMLRINEYLHFLLGNGIIVDVFSEYQNTVKNLMSTLIYKYSIQEKQILHKRLFEEFSESKISFDEVDFYCLTEFFSDRDLVDLFQKHSITTISFYNMSIIETTIKNTMDYYEYLLNNNGGVFELLSLQTDLKTIFALSRYIDLSQALVEKMIQFILNHEFRNILISDKIIFLNSQLKTRKMNNPIISTIIEDALVRYFDMHIEAELNKKDFELFSSISNINYYNLAHYIEHKGKPCISKELSKRVNTVIKYNLTSLIRPVAINYWNVIQPYQKRKFIAWIKSLLREDFKFELFKYLVFCNARIDNDIQDMLRKHLRDSINIANKQSGTNGVMIYPKPDPYEELELVGYWCLINKLKSKDYIEFLGVNNSFDLYCLYKNANLANFDVSKLLYLNNAAIKRLAKNSKVKTQIRQAIADKLNDKSIIESDEKKLHEILLKYFC